MLVESMLRKVQVSKGQPEKMCGKLTGTEGTNSRWKPYELIIFSQKFTYQEEQLWGENGADTTDNLQEGVAHAA